MKKLLIVLVLVMVLAVAGLAEVQHLQNITVKLPTGTGFHIGNGRILTAAHLIKPYMENAIWVKNGEHGMVARLIKIDRELDLALLGVEKTNYPEILLKLETEVDEGVISVVNFGLFEDIFLRGKVVGYGYYKDREYIVIDMTIIPGMSGAGVFSGGKLIGIVRLLYGDTGRKVGDFVALIIPAKTIKKFLEE